MCQLGKEQPRPVAARVIVQPGVSSKAPEVRRSSKAQDSRNTMKMMEILPWQGRDISSSTSKPAVSARPAE
jgi:hypothetical protein